MVEDAITEIERIGLKCVAEEMFEIIFDETVLDRLLERGLVERTADSWVLTPAGAEVAAD